MPELFQARRPGRPGNPWSVDRWGRLLAGSVVLVFGLLGLLHHPLWCGAVIAVAGSLILTSLTDRCMVHDLLIKLGAREREDLFFPGGRVRSGAVSLPDNRQLLSPSRRSD